MKMRKALYFVFAMSVLLFSCNKDEKEEGREGGENAMDMPLEGLMMDAGEIAELQLYGLQKAVYMSGFDIPAVYRDEVKDKGELVFPDYQSIRLYAWFVRHGYGLIEDSAKATKILRMERDYYYHKTDFILEQYNKLYQLQTPVEWPLLFTAYVNGDVTLTCNKTLFGKDSGKNLSQHFMVSPAYCCVPIGRGENSEMLYSFNDIEKLSTGICMTDFFKKDSWMQSAYLIRFIDKPTERYDELTFTLTFPASLEHVREFCTSKYKGENAPMRVTDTTYTASFTAKFNWN